MEKRKRQLWTMNVRRVDEPMIERLYLASEAVGLPAVHIVRQAIREKLARLAAEYPEINEMPAPQPAAATSN